MIPCPRCAAAVQPDWDWCHACGYDPEGLRPTDGSAAPAAATGPPRSPAPGQPRPSALGPAPVYAPPSYGGPSGGRTAYGAPPRRSGAATAIKAVLIIGTAFVALIVVLVAAVALLGTTPTNQVGTVGPAASPVGAPVAPWTTWTAPDGSFHLDFPVSPASQPMAMDDPKFGGGAMVIADLGSSAYLMAYFEPSAAYEVTDPSAVLDGALDGMVTSTGMTMDSRTPSTFGYLPSIDFSGHASEDGQAFDVAGTVFTSARRTFILMTLDQPGAPIEHDRFVTSFAAG